MLRKKNIYLEESLLRELDKIIKKIKMLEEADYAKWDIDRTDLVRFAIASAYGLAYPYVDSGKVNLKKPFKKVKEFKNKK